jgi:hypothetical protein
MHVGQTRLLQKKQDYRVTCVKRVLEHRHLPWWLGALAFALASPAIGVGLVLDDYFHRASLLALPQLPELRRTPLELFAFVRDDRTSQLGFLPWWASPELRLAFFRPLTGLTHALDLALWRDQPRWMHVHSLLWLAAAVVAAAHLYRRLSSQSLAPWVAGLAGLAFALDDAHATPAGWIANRNATIAAVFAIASLLAYDRWRRDAWQPGMWLAPLCLGLGLLGGEAAVGGGAYLLSYALFIDRGSLRSRLLAIAPPAAVGVVWWLAYRVLGYGARNSAIYIDPGAHPLSFFGAVLERAPLLLMGQLGFPPSDIPGVASHQVARGLWLFAVAGLTVLATLVWPLLRRERAARFWALGMVLSLLPVCATTPSDRLLFVPGLGGMALTAIFVATALGDAAQAPSLSWRRLARPLACVLLVVHLVLAPLLFVKIVAQLRDFGATIRRVAATFPADPQIVGQHAIVTHAPTVQFAGFAQIINALEGKPIPSKFLVLASSVYPVEIERTDGQTLVVRPEGGFLLRPGTGPPGPSLPALWPGRFLQAFEWLWRNADEPFPAEPIVHDGVTIKVLELTDDARPATVCFRFPLPLEDPHWRWIRWHQGVFVEFQPPSIGETVRLGSLIE